MDEKEVYFNLYCKTCLYATKVDTDGALLEVCDDCLGTPMNTNSHKPVNYKEASK